MDTLTIGLGPVEIHLDWMAAAARWIMAEKLRSVLSLRKATRLNSLSLQKKFSIRCRHLEISVSIWRGQVRRECWAITTLAPRSSRSAIKAFESKAVSAIRPPKAPLSISGATPTVSKR